MTNNFMVEMKRQFDKQVYIVTNVCPTSVWEVSQRDAALVILISVCVCVISDFFRSCVQYDGKYGILHKKKTQNKTLMLPLITNPTGEYNLWAYLNRIISVWNMCVCGRTSSFDEHSNDD